MDFYRIRWVITSDDGIIGDTSSGITTVGFYRMA